MKFSTGIISAAFLLSSVASAVDLRYDNTYDNPNGDMTTVACSDGSNGLITRYKFHHFKDIPNFPHIGAAQAIAGWNSSQCGTCWKLTFNGKSINVLAIDHAGSGFNVAQAAMDELTNGNAIAFGVVDVSATQVDVSNCGL
ncbi:Asp f 13-like protein [Dendrothele bispora CBS 962.96]|uniref:Asp f 13-like protein n=1 Tax=Dendrothele bispora (strain CBS 962.96) TaxID=1314807 RepID=A0A4S8LXF7_DENBC|nr:Asp f 13-like protein [Dendrothele bispora CBS 962.96]